VQTSLQKPDVLPVPSQLNYCSAGAADTLSVLPCVTGPDAWVMAPSTGGHDMFVATRVKDVIGNQEVRSFVVNPEAYTLGVTFTAQALSFYHDTSDSLYSKSLQDLTTTLVDGDGVSYTNGIKRISRFDVIQVSTLLHAAGIHNLDAVHDSDPEASIRYDGLTLLLNIECPMDPTGTVNGCEYKVRHMYQSVGEAFVVNQYNASVSGGVGSQERRGISIKISVSGEMGRFDLESLLIAWVASLAMLEIVTLIINAAMNYFLPFKSVYRMLMYDESPNFHDLRNGSKKAEKAIDRLRVERLSQAGQMHSPPMSPKLKAVGATVPASPGRKAIDAAPVPASAVKLAARPPSPTGVMTTSPGGTQHNQAAAMMIAQQRAMAAASHGSPAMQDPRSRSTSPHTPGSHSAGGASGSAVRPATPPQEFRSRSPQGANALKQQAMQNSGMQGGYRQRAPNAISVDPESF